MQRNHALRNIVIILLLLVLIPTAFYTVYEFSTLSTNEQLLSEMYNRQLDAILYSVNDHAMTMVTNWANRSSKTFEYLANGDMVRALELEMRAPRDITVRQVRFSDSTGKFHAVPWPFTVQDSSMDSVAWEATLQRNAWKLERLVRYLRSGYRKVEPLFVGDSASSSSRVVLVFAFRTQPSVNLISISLDEEQFTRNVIGRKLSDIAAENFILGVVLKHSPWVIFSTSPTAAEDLRQQKQLWLFPNYMLGIRLKGTTIDELAQSRTKRNVILIVLMDVVLLAGAWFVYKSIRREMELVKLKSDFVSNVSHELRTPLALIRMYGETLEMGRVKSDEKKQEYYGTIVKESERLTRLVNNILDFSKMEAGKKQYSFASVQLNDVVRNVMATYEYHLKGEGFAPVVELDDTLPLVPADIETVAEAVVNLIDNAVKYSGNSRSLKVKTVRRNDACVIAVEDHGIGIASEHHNRIFDKFFRVGSALVHNTKGSGLGLALVKHIMDAHDGRVEVESIVGKGSTFRLMFPVK